MKALKTLSIMMIILMSAVSVFAQSGFVATPETIEQLRKDIRNGQIKVGITRQMKIIRTYGLPSKIDDAEKKTTYDYGDLQITFDKKRYMRSWEYDPFKKPAYSDSIDDLRFDLESFEIVGDYWTAKQIRSDYDEPTDISVTDDDGGTTIYWYGNIKLVFENVFTVKSWKGKDLDKVEDEGVLGTE